MSVGLWEPRQASACDYSLVVINKFSHVMIDDSSLLIVSNEREIKQQQREREVKRMKQAEPFKCLKRLFCEL